MDSYSATEMSMTSARPLVPPQSPSLTLE